MKKITVFCGIVLGLLSLNSCLTVHTVPIQTLQSAEIRLPEIPNRMAVIIREGYLLSSEVNKEDDKESIDSLMLNAAHTLARYLNDNDVYSHTYIEVVKRPFEGFPKVENYKSLFDEYRFDQIIVADSLFLIDQYQYGNEAGLTYAIYDLTSTVRWRVLSKNVEGIIDEYISKDTMRWINPGLTVSAALDNLPKRQDAFWDMGMEIAKTYAGHISPMWTDEDRTIFTSARTSSQLAKMEYENGGIDSAIYIWESALKDTKSEKTSAWLCHNLAVAYESKDMIEKALEYCQKSVSYFDGKKKENLELTDLEKSCRQYYRRLQQRVKN